MMLVMIMTMIMVMMMMIEITKRPVMMNSDDVDDNNEG